MGRPFLPAIMADPMLEAIGLVKGRSLKNEASRRDPEITGEFPAAASRS